MAKHQNSTRKMFSHFPVKNRKPIIIFLLIERDNFLFIFCSLFGLIYFLSNSSQKNCDWIIRILNYSRFYLTNQISTYFKCVLSMAVYFQRFKLARFKKRVLKGKCCPGVMTHFKLLVSFQSHTDQKLILATFLYFKVSQ